MYILSLDKKQSKERKTMFKKDIDDLLDVKRRNNYKIMWIFFFSKITFIHLYKVFELIWT